MLQEILVTGQRPASSGIIQARSSRDGMQVVMDGHSHYQQAVLDGNVYIAANPAGTPVTTQAGLSATTPVMTIYNPVGSGINVVLWDVCITVTAAPAAATVFCYALNLVGAAAPTALTSANIVNANGSVAQPKFTLASRVATLAAAPIAYRYPGMISAASLVSPVVFLDNLDGKMVLSPGACWSVQTLAAAAVLTSVVFEEVPF